MGGAGDTLGLSSRGARGWAGGCVGMGCAYTTCYGACQLCIKRTRMNWDGELGRLLGSTHKAPFPATLFTMPTLSISHP